MPELTDAVDRIAAETGFTGVVSVDTDGEVSLARAYGPAHRALAVPNTVDTRFGLASGSKSFTALAVVSLVVDGTLALATTARSVLGADLPLIDDAVTVGQLLAHRSGIGDYLDEYAEDYDVNDYPLPVPVHTLDTAESYLAVLDGFPTTFPPGERFSYCNGGFVVLALIAERASGVPYHELVTARVLAPAGMTDSGYFRSDDLPARTALGYLHPPGGGDRTNLLHLPVRGGGDGGAYATAADLSRLWRSLFDGRIVPPQWVAELVRPHSEVPPDEDEPPEAAMRYGLGFWLRPDNDIVLMGGQDTGVSFRSEYDPHARRCYTALGNTTDGAWTLHGRLKGLLAGG